MCHFCSEARLEYHPLPTSNCNEQNRRSIIARERTPFTTYANVLQKFSTSSFLPYNKTGAHRSEHP